MGKFLITIILALSFLIRIWDISSNPPELFSDEITHVLSARTILETGKDINGSVGVYFYNKLKLGAPIYGYLAAFSTYIFGLNTFAIRFPAVVAGTITVFLIYKLIFLISKDYIAALAGTFLTAITPWNIYFSRIGWEPSLVLPFLTGLILVFFTGVKTNSLKRVIFAYVLSGISIYSADAMEFLVPIFLLLLITLNNKHVLNNKVKHLLGIIIFSIILLPLIHTALKDPLKHNRSIKISTFNKGVNLTSLQTFGQNYLAHFKSDFLFKFGDPNLRHGTGHDGVLYWIYLPFIILGIIYSLKHINKNYLLTLIWLFLFPLGGSLTNDGVPHATRTLIGAPVLILYTSVGFSRLMRLKNKSTVKFLITLSIILLGYQVTKFVHSYFVTYPINSQPWWEYGQKQIFSAVKNNAQGSESLCLTNVEYWHQDTYPNYYLGVNNNYKIIFDQNNPECFRSEILVLSSRFQVPPGYDKLNTVYNLQNQPIWIIYKDDTR